MKRLWILALPLLGMIAVGVYGTYYRSTAFADSYTPDTYNLQIQQGEDFAKTLALADGNKHPLNLTGYQFAAQARQQPGASAVMLNFSTVVNASAGTVQLRARKALTATLANKSGYWDMLMTLPDGSATYLLKGQFFAAPTVTR